MINIFWACFVLLLWKATYASASTEVIFLISSQQGSYYHRQLSLHLRNDILQQSKALTADYKVHVHMLHELLNQPGDWTLLPVLADLQRSQFTPALVNNSTKWIIICEEHTEIKVQILLDKLAYENHNEPNFFGYPLFDKEATIIHHFAFFENPKWFPYPMLRAGVILSVSLFRSLAAVITRQGIASGTRLPTRTTEFSIDAAHELALFIVENIHMKSEKHLENVATNNSVDFNVSVIKTNDEHRSLNEYISSKTAHTTADSNRVKNLRKIILQKASYICPSANIKPLLECAMRVKPIETNSTSCLFPTEPNQVFVAIKTCEKFHKERIPIIEATWVNYAMHKRYYSDVSDANIPTVNAGVPNAETGHCEKTLAIFKLALKDIEHINREAGNATIRWLLLCDDDTLLSISRLCDFLGCFNHTDVVYLGERYGYRLHAKDGFNYITGGGGIVFSLPTVRLIVKHCSCPSATSPDDMILGSCLHTLGVKAIHSSKFHQARPKDYSQELLEMEHPISFHKFWQLDPFYVYERWFSAADQQMLKTNLHSKNNKQRSKLLSHLRNSSKEIDKIHNKTKSDSLCKSKQGTNGFIANLDSRDDVAIAALKQETNSHLDL